MPLSPSSFAFASSYPPSLSLFAPATTFSFAFAFVAIFIIVPTFAPS
jgi:hypothetical protein